VECRRTPVTCGGGRATPSCVAKPSYQADATSGAAIVSRTRNKLSARPASRCPPFPGRDRGSLACPAARESSLPARVRVVRVRKTQQQVTGSGGHVWSAPDRALTSLEGTACPSPELATGRSGTVVAARSRPGHRAGSVARDHEARALGERRAIAARIASPLPGSADRRKSATRLCWSIGIGGLAMTP
jgi:hypothetical protein